MKDSNTKFIEIIDTLEAQLKCLEDIRKVITKKKEKEMRLCQRVVSLRVRNVHNVDDFLNWFGTKDWPLIFEEKSPQPNVMTEEVLKEALKSALPNLDDQFERIKVKIDAVEEDVDDILSFLQESIPKKVSITNIVNKAHASQVKKAQMKKESTKDPDLSKPSTQETSESLDFVGLIGSLDTMTILKKVFDSLHMKPTMHQSKELLFSRMAEKYVAMLMSIPTGYNDVILNKIPKALSQATYVAFFDGLRTHHQYFDDNFKQYIFSYITKWTTGITPQPGAGNKEREKMAKLTGERTETIAEMLTHSILSNKPVKLDLTMQDLEDLQKHQENKSLFKVSPMKEVPRLSVTKDTPKQKETCEPEVAVDNLHLEKVKFDLYSQCPLVNYCMYNRKMSAIYMIPSNQIIQRLQRTEKTPEKTFLNNLKQ
ncbi:protein FAM227B isoform X2 [Octopus bimaculoides]|uniref:protein FAM227B isoform X2 n=1 Tax=Octopus bimaculoides TaxID=37653 RepID=UPI00071D9914|nr:protein FAM227B isoform X2 [Octopus bimaculoides]|eukprot:XP_014779102.1 PREDICTED: protein FAM227B-like isoform X2 [Octopus bimaculoides]